jgi:hypothetical protein
LVFDFRQTAQWILSFVSAFKKAETKLCTYCYEHSLLHWFKFFTANPKAKQFRLTQHLWVSTQICLINC